jgi:hypothetical protein
MVKNIAFFQIWLLRTFGFLSSPSESTCGRVKKWFRTTVAISLLLGGLLCFSITLGQQSLQIVQNRSQKLFLKIFLALPYVFVSLRPVVLLSILLYKNSAIQLVCKSVQTFHKVTFKNDILYAEQKSLHRKLSVGIFFITAGLVSGPFAWLMTMAVIARPATQFFAEDVLLPLPIRMQLWLFIVLWSVFYTFNSILSQQIPVILILHASVLGDALKRVNLEIRECIEWDVKEMSWFELEKRMVNWKSVTTQARILCRMVNDSFNLILFGMYSLDFATLLGFGVNILMEKQFGEMFAYNASVAAVFISFITVFLIPLVIVYEQV